MVENSKIEWTDHTFNPWIGCQHVSPGCDHCYAETQNAHRKWNGGTWGPGSPRTRTSSAYWQQPFRWNATAQKEGTRPRVFCASLADVFDNQAPHAVRCDLWELICATPHLDWLLLTKRPQNIAKMLPSRSRGALLDWGVGYPNVWLGTTVENQEEADRRIPHLLAVPATKRFLSCEPMLGPVDLSLEIGAWPVKDPNKPRSDWTMAPYNAGIHWVICGGESGPKARPMHPDWARSLRDQCVDAGVPFFFKQWGEWGLEDQDRRTEPHAVAAEDGTLYAMADLAYPEGKRRGEAIRADHTHLHTVYRVGKKAAGALLDGREWREFPPNA